MEKYLVKVTSREQFQNVIDYVGTDTEMNRFDVTDTFMFIKVDGTEWVWLDGAYFLIHMNDEKYDDYQVYTFLEFAEEKLGWTQTFATHAQEVDMINSPNHYNQFSREVIDTMKGMSTAEEFKGFLKLNAVKYLSRYQGKNGAEDLDKAIWYIERLKSEISEQL